MSTYIENDRWKIWIEYYDHNGDVTGLAVHPNTYAHKSSATRRAQELFQNSLFASYYVSKTNPFEDKDAEIHIPKKPEYGTPNLNSVILIARICPVCKYSMTGIIRHPRCPRCFQKLDWSVEGE